MLNYLTQGTTLTFQSIFVDDAYANEEWKPIKGFKNYMISNMGRVKHLAYTSNNKTYKETILAPRKIKGGYIIVRLIKDDNWKDYYVHRLVCEAFCPNPYKFNEVNHKDENKENNNADNLEWCNRYYNNNYGTRKEKVSKALKKPIVQFTKDGEFVKKWDGAVDVEREMAIPRQGIYNCCNGKQQTSGGYKWCYALKYA